MNKYKKLVSNTAILGIGQLSSKVLVYLLMRLYTSCLTTAEYSTADLLTQTATLLMPISAGGICSSILRFTLDYSDEERRHKVFSTGVSFLSLTTLVFLLFSPLLSFANSFFSGYAWIIVIYVITANFHTAVAGYIHGRGEMTLFAVQGILNTAIVILLNIIFLPIFDFGVVGYVSSIMIANVCTTIFLVVKRKLWRHYNIKLFDKGLIKKMLRYSLPLIPTLVFWWITALSDRFMIIGMLSSTLGEEGAKAVNGLYSTAQKLPTVVTLITEIFLDAWNFSAVTESDKKEERTKFFSEIFKPFASLLVLAGAGIILFSELLTKLMVAPAFAESQRFVPILVCSTIFSGLASFLGSVYTVEKKSSMSLLTSMIAAISNILMNLLLIPIVGAMGAAIATVLSYVLLFSIRCVNTRFFIPFKIDFLTLIPSLILVIISSLFMTFALPMRYIVCTVTILLLLVINRKPIISALSVVLSAVRRKVVNKQ